MRLREFMRTSVVTIESTEAASVAWSRMRQRRIRHLVVTDNGRVVGIISERDLGGRDDQVEDEDVKKNAGDGGVAVHEIAKFKVPSSKFKVGSASLNLAL